MTGRAAKNPLILASLLAFACYCTQAVVNLSVPITAPFMWAFLAMGLVIVRAENKQKASEEISAEK